MVFCADEIFDKFCLCKAKDAVIHKKGDARALITEIEDGCDYLVGREVAKTNPQVSSSTASDATVPTTTAITTNRKRNVMHWKNSIA